MNKKSVIAVLGFFATTSALASSLSGKVTIEDARYNPSVPIEKIIEISAAPNLSQQCGGVGKTYGGSELNPYARIAEIDNYQLLCGIRPTQFIQIRWRANHGRWIVENFGLPPHGIEPYCNISIKLEDNVNPNWPATFKMMFTEGCGRP